MRLSDEMSRLTVTFRQTVDQKAITHSHHKGLDHSRVWSLYNQYVDRMGWYWKATNPGRGHYGDDPDRYLYTRKGTRDWYVVDCRLMLPLMGWSTLIKRSFVVPFRGVRDTETIRRYGPPAHINGARR